MPFAKRFNFVNKSLIIRLSRLHYRESLRKLHFWSAKIWCLLNSIRNESVCCWWYKHYLDVWRMELKIKGDVHDSFFFYQPKMTEWQRNGKQRAKKPLDKHCLPNTPSVNKNCVCVTSLILDLCKRVVVWRDDCGLEMHESSMNCWFCIFVIFTMRFWIHSAIVPIFNGKYLLCDIASVVSIGFIAIVLNGAALLNEQFSNSQCILYALCVHVDENNPFWLQNGHMNYSFALFATVNHAYFLRIVFRCVRYRLLTDYSYFMIHSYCFNCKTSN